MHRRISQRADRRQPSAKLLAHFGFTERQARFLVTVMLHSGVFVGWHRIKPRGRGEIVEAAGVEFERSAIGNYLMARDFWLNTLN